LIAINSGAWLNQTRNVRKNANHDKCKTRDLPENEKKPKLLL